MKRPSDRKSAMITLRVQKSTRAELRKMARPHESLSDTVRRLMQFAMILLAKDDALSAGETETRT